MPNIELHGFDEKEERELFFKIKNALKDEDFFNDAVVTLCNDVVADFNDNKRPFVRICSTAHEERILEVFQEKGINADMEVQPVKKFIPAKK